MTKLIPTENVCPSNTSSKCSFRATQNYKYHIIETFKYFEEISEYIRQNTKIKLEKEIELNNLNLPVSMVVKTWGLDKIEKVGEFSAKING